ncbi:MAG: nuclear transport factor 2 family protein [Friedmanniella sp.]|jgi:hypothetical protein
MTTISTDLPDLKAAIESRDAEAVSAWYAHDAVLTIVDRDHPPADPTVYRGREEIGSYFAIICGRNIQHAVDNLIATEDGLAYTQRCRYPEGAGVVCNAVAHLTDGRISTQTVVQAWDA